ncbi:MAG TPA: ABC transporter ATP-binding protein [Terriglobales bacterium]|nr:ABC transporter ATP-binding protein [Terriglobales bacterium]
MSTPRDVPLLSVSLSVGYRNKPAVLKSAFLEMRQGEVLGLIGQSGSGKSTLALSILRLLEMKGGHVSGSVFFQGSDLLKLKESQMRKLRGSDIGLVLQSPLSSLNPALRIGSQLMEAWKAHASGPREEGLNRIKDVFASVSLPSEEEFLRRYPSQLSVGQAQRVLIAMAVLHRPALLIADEPTSALDVITQAEILQLFRQLNRELGTGILYISHDLLSVASVCDRIAILNSGEIVECGATGQIFNRPAHPYTRKLIDALPEKPAIPDERRYRAMLRPQAITIQ